MARRTQVTFASCNLFNINLPGLPIYNDKDGWDQEIYDKKVAWTGQMINTVGSDIWGFQELWHAKALKDVFKAAKPEEEYTLMAPPGHAGESIVCAGAVRKDILVGEPEWISDFPEKFRLDSGGDDPQTGEIAVSIHAFSRPVLHFRVKPRSNGKTISVYVAHLKSKAPSKIYYEQWYKDHKTYYSKHSSALGAAISTIRRTAEAAALRMILTEEMKGNENPVVVLGDLNDSQLSNTLNILTGQPNYLLSGLDKGGSDTALYTTGTLQEYRSLRDVYYTHIYQKIKETLDHILVSQEFYDNSRKRLWAFKGMELFNDHLNADNHKEDGLSDHGIVRATFEYRPAK
ncbi:endonuclease/exonuclease/phosphatase family protein [Candidatus Thiodiazotropha sp. CDECU1]|uniref:endonuclease/exonuclease/phosphatase family protein n=1 Tax=Candidatus Thiodiazotropha sp. CDECU1 TaxID=3065865 RepID=UPI00293002A4|nr:endonuclease/exonuclease/phosphatase family protein [Candidatus Thiodiazotropha sp. CDECU1]